MMELNKYDLVEWVAYTIGYYIKCSDCPIKQECCVRKKPSTYLCYDEDEAKEILIKKFNL